MKFDPFKDFQSDQIQRSSRKIFTAQYACRNADLNLTLVTGTTNGFIFQIINSCLDCNGFGRPGAVRVKGGMRLRNGMWHGLRNDVIMRNVKYGKMAQRNKLN